MEGNASVYQVNSVNNIIPYMEYDFSTILYSGFILQKLETLGGGAVNVVKS